MQELRQGRPVVVKQAAGLWQPIPGRRQRPVYPVGPKGAKEHGLILFQCPLSAVPSFVWDLLLLWWDCRTMRVLPMAGGWLDQPKLVQRAFPVFEREMKQLESLGQPSASDAAMMAVSGMVAAMAGGGGRRQR